MRVFASKLFAFMIPCPLQNYYSVNLKRVNFNVLDLATPKMWCKWMYEFKIHLRVSHLPRISILRFILHVGSPLREVATTHCKGRSNLRVIDSIRNTGRELTLCQTINHYVTRKISDNDAIVPIVIIKSCLLSYSLPVNVFYTDSSK